MDGWVDNSTASCQWLTDRTPALLVRFSYTRVSCNNVSKLPLLNKVDQ
jgi:hypothetical protein